MNMVAADSVFWPQNCHFSLSIDSYADQNQEVFRMYTFKGIVHPTIKMMSSFTLPQVFEEDILDNVSD